MPPPSPVLPPLPPVGSSPPLQPMLETRATPTSAAVVGNPGASWRLDTVADFNGDGHTDILWRDDSGAVGIWFMNGAKLQSSDAFDAGLSPTSWHILGTADFFRLSGRTWTGSEFAEVNSPEAQRFFNYLCIALGGAPKSFDFLVNPKEQNEPLLPDRRAERCQNEYQQVRMAFNLRIMPYVDPDILVKVRAIQWLFPINGR